MNASDVLWILFFLSVGTASLWLSRQWYRQPISPLSIYIGINSFSLALYHLRLVRLRQISGGTYLVVIISFISFFVGASLYGPLTARGRRQAPRLPNFKGLDGFFYLTVLVSTVGWTVPLYILVQRYGLDFLLSNLWVLQPEFQMKYLGYLNVLGIAVLPTFLIRRTLGRSRRFDILLVGSSLIGLVLAGIKTYFIYSLVVSVILYALYRLNRLSIKHFFVIFLVFTIILVFFVSYDATIDIFSAVQLPGSSLPESLAFFERPYVYFVGSWPAMDILVSDQAHPSQPIFGYVTLQPLWKILGDGLGLIEPVPPYLPAVDITSTEFNVYAFIGEVYWDFGLAGVVLLSLTFGLITTRLYLKARSGSSWVDKLLYAMVGYLLAISFFSYFLRFETVVLILYVYIVGRLLSWNSSRMVPQIHAA